MQDFFPGKITNTLENVIAGIREAFYYWN